jgi:perosamine synthetase
MKKKSDSWNKKKHIPYSTHYIDDKDIAAVTKVLKSRYLTQGQIVLDFENKVANYVGSKYAVAVSSCTAGMHIACKALGFNKKSKLLTSVISFVSSANVAHFLDGKVYFADINLNDLNISLEDLEKKIKKINPQIVIPVHMGGHPCDMVKIKELSKKYKFKIVEDAAHALGSNYLTTRLKDRVGNCRYSDVAVFSLHPVKTITTGEGGIITTNNKDTYVKLLRLRSHGINKANDKFLNKRYAYTKGKLNPWYYEMRELGYHYRITDIQCALGITQLKKINSFVKQRKKSAKRYDKVFSKMENIDTFQGFNRNLSSNHLYITKINYKKINKTRADLMNYLKKKNIISQVHYIPIVMHHFYEKLGHKIKDYPLAKEYYEKCLSIPNHFKLTYKQQNYIISCLKKFLKN